MIEKTAHELIDLLRRREVSSTELTQAYLDKIEQVDGKIRAFVTVDREGALKQAKEIDDRRSRGEALGPLAGLPVAIKDNICTKGLRTTCSSRMLENFRPPYDATVVERLRSAGMVVIGKTNLDEFAMGSSTENSAFGPTRNPWDTDRVPGGSSGGSAAAVAAMEAPLALGSDTGGSIRMPAGFCGVVGIKPTYGLVSRYGLVAFASSLDQIGPLGADVTDCAHLLSVIAGYDERDSTSVDQSVPDYLASLTGDVKGMVIGLPKEYFAQGIEEQVRDAVLGAVGVLEQLGARVEEVSLPTTEYSLSTYYIIAPSEASSNLARYDGVRYGYRADGAVDSVSMFMKTRDEGFGAEVKRRIMIGTYALSAGYYDAYYRKAQQARALIRRDFESAFARCDVLITPTTPSTAFRLGEKADDPMAMYMSDICTVTANLAGIPGMSVPCGFHRGLPIGMQILADSFDEPTMLRVAYAYEQASGLVCSRPELA